MRVLAAVVASLLFSAVALAYSGGDSGVGIGVTVPEGDLADINDTSYYLQARTLFARKTFGGRASMYYADTIAHGPVDGGRALGFDVDGLLRFGGRQTFGYVFAGAGYGRATFSRPGDLPGSVVRSSEWDWTLQGGVGVVIKKIVYLEAQYVQFQTDPKTSFIPVVIGFQY
ncbi:MAG TPA: hypothetical protein VJ826_12235 [Candidatus Polarisedimenticolaceae bacterium]|nr:hypothetical protein [Candidatus Polarisedimenticolaceae bacterium]